MEGGAVWQGLSLLWLLLSHFPGDGDDLDDLGLCCKWSIDMRAKLAWVLVV